MPLHQPLIDELTDYLSRCQRSIAGVCTRRNRSPVRLVHAMPRLQHTHALSGRFGS